MRWPDWQNDFPEPDKDVKDIWKELIRNAAKFHGVTLPAPSLKSYIKCSFCGKVFLPRGKHYDQHLCTHKHIQFPIPLTVPSYHEIEAFKTKHNLHDCPLPNYGIDLLMKSKIIFESQGIGEFLKNFNNRKRAITVAEVYDWISNTYPKLKLYGRPKEV